MCCLNDESVSALNGQDLNEIPPCREGEREPQDEGHEDFQAHLFSVTSQFPAFPKTVIQFSPLVL